MFKKTERLDRPLFSHFFKIGRRFSTKYLTIIRVPHPTLKVSVVVGKKVFKKAYQRNKLRRQIYHLVREVVRENNLGGGLIFIAKPISKELTKHEIFTTLKTEIKQIIK